MRPDNVFVACEPCTEGIPKPISYQYFKSLTPYPKPARVKKVSDKDNIEHYYVVVSKREGVEQVFLFMKVKRPVAPHTEESEKHAEG